MTARPIRIRLTAHQARKVAVAASVDPRTVRRVLRGDPVRSSTGARVRTALARLGFIPRTGPQAGDPSVCAGAACVGDLAEAR